MATAFAFGAGPLISIRRWFLRSTWPGCLACCRWWFTDWLMQKRLSRPALPARARRVSRRADVRLNEAKTVKPKDRKAAQAAKEEEARQARERQEQLPTLKKHYAIFGPGPEANILG
jgi:hypothetical protein